MNFSRTSKFVLGLMLTSVIAPTHGAQRYFKSAFDQELEASRVGQLKKEKELIKAISGNIADVEIAEALLEEGTPQERVANSGVTKDLTVIGEELTSENKEKARYVRRALGTNASKDKVEFQATYQIATELSKKGLYETTFKGKKREDVIRAAKVEKDTKGNLDAFKVEDVEKIEKIRDGGLKTYTGAALAAYEQLTNLGNGKKFHIEHPTQDQVDALAFLKSRGQDNPEQALLNDIVYLQGVGFKEPSQVLYAAYGDLKAGNLNFKAISSPTAKDIFTAYLLKKGGKALTGENFQELLSFLNPIESALSSQGYKLTDVGVEDFIKGLTNGFDAHFGIKNGADFKNVLLNYVGLRKAGVAADRIDKDLVVAFPQIKKINPAPSVGFLKAYFNVQRLLNKEQPTRDEVDLMLWASSAHINPSEEDFHGGILKKMKDVYKSRTNGVTQGHYDTFGVLIEVHPGLTAAENDEFVRLEAAHFDDATIDDVKESLRLQALNEGRIEAPTEDQIKESLRLKGLAEAAIQSPTKKDVEDSLKLKAIFNDPNVGNAQSIARYRQSLAILGTQQDVAPGLPNPTAGQVASMMNLLQSGVVADSEEAPLLALKIQTEVNGGDADYFPKMLATYVSKDDNTVTLRVIPIAPPANVHHNGSEARVRNHEIKVAISDNPGFIKQADLDNDPKVFVIERLDLDGANGTHVAGQIEPLYM